MGTTAENLHIDQMLSNVAIGYQPDGLIASAIAPVVPVPKQSDGYPIFSRADTLRNEESLRAPGAPANRITRNVTSALFYCPNYALAYPITLEDRANADPVFTMEMIEGNARYTQDKIYLGWEIRVANTVNSTSNVGSSFAVSSAWTDSVNATPLNDLNTAMNVAQDLTGKRPNKVVFGNAAWRSLRVSQQVTNKLYGNNNGGGYATREGVRNLLEVRELLVGEAYQNTGNEAQAEALSNIWADNVLVAYIPPAPTIFEPSYMYTFRWRRPGLPELTVERHPFNTVEKTELTEVGVYQTEKVTGSDYAVLLLAVNSST